MAVGGRGRVIAHHASVSFCSPQIKLTMPIINKPLEITALRLGSSADLRSEYLRCRQRGGIGQGLALRQPYSHIVRCGCVKRSRAMLVVTTENVVGHRVVEVKGQCFGVVVRSRGLGGNVMAGLRSIIGGEIHEYTHLLEDTRRQAVDRLVQNATVMGANAVLMMRFDSSEIGQTMSEIVAYGTAAMIEPLPG
jgi:uncharacterized protein YbjQ (UPF0145 family)